MWPKQEYLKLQFICDHWIPLSRADSCNLIQSNMFQIYPIQYITHLSNPIEDLCNFIQYKKTYNYCLPKFHIYPIQYDTHVILYNPIRYICIHPRCCIFIHSNILHIYPIQYATYVSIQYVTSLSTYVTYLSNPI